MTTMAAVHPIDAFIVPSDAVFKSGCRLEGSFYGSDGYRAARALFRSGFDLQLVGDHAAVFNPPIFKRVYVEDEESGIPYATGSTVLEARPAKDVFLSRALTDCLDQLSVREGMVLISDSGSIGRTVLATREIDGWVSTNNLIRVISNDRARFSQEFFYTFFVTSVGEYLLTNSTYGSVVEHIDPVHVRETSFPILPHKLRDRLTEIMGRVTALRVAANALLDDADAEVHRQCALPSLSDLQVHSAGYAASSAHIFQVRSHDVFGQQNRFGSVRLDATYYDPLAAKLRKLILGSGGKELGSVLLGVRNSRLRKRLYVDDPSDGVPMIGGKQLMQIRPSDVSYLSKALTRNLQEETVRTGWTLVSCGGTLGRTLFVHRNLEGWAVSQHVMRLLPDESQVWPGYLYAFVASPYGQIQVAQRAYGSVIPELRDFQFDSIAIAVPPDRGRAIHDTVVRAFDCRADAFALENEAIRLFEAAIEEGRDATEEKWGREY
jgi:type I restriction enzyme S subunit